MYYIRHKEDTYALQAQLHEAKTELDCAMRYSPDDTDLITTISHEIEELEKRIEKAWAEIDLPDIIDCDVETGN